MLIISSLKEHNIITCIDGAHAPGQLELSMRKLQPDFYVGNLHKWVYAMRGTALVYISEPFKHVIQRIEQLWFSLKFFCKL